MNLSECIFISCRYSHQHRPHRKQRHYDAKETQTLIKAEEKKNLQSLSRHRPMPSMGISYAILRNSSLSPKTSAISKAKTNKTLSTIQSPTNNHVNSTD